MIQLLNLGSQEVAATGAFASRIMDACLAGDGLADFHQILMEESQRQVAQLRPAERPGADWLRRKIHFLAASLAALNDSFDRSDVHPHQVEELEHALGLKRLRSELREWRRGFAVDPRQSLRTASFDASRRLLAFHCGLRGDESADVVVVNLSTHPQWRQRLHFPAEGLWALQFNSDWELFNKDSDGWYGSDVVSYPDDSGDLAFHADVIVGPLSLLIYSQRSDFLHHRYD